MSPSHKSVRVAPKIIDDINEIQQISILGIANESELIISTNQNGNYGCPIVMNINKSFLPQNEFEIRNYAEGGLSKVLYSDAIDKNYIQIKLVS